MVNWIINFKLLLLVCLLHYENTTRNVDKQTMKQVGTKIAFTTSLYEISKIPI